MGAIINAIVILYSCVGKLMAPQRFDGLTRFAGTLINYIHIFWMPHHTYNIFSNMFFFKVSRKTFKLKPNILCTPAIISRVMIEL